MIQLIKFLGLKITGRPYTDRVLCRIDHNVFNEILIVISFFLNSESWRI